MPDDSRPDLMIEALSSGEKQTAPLAVPPGCSVSVEAMVLSVGSSATAPSAGPPGTSNLGAPLAANGSAPTQPPPDAIAGRG